MLGRKAKVRSPKVMKVVLSCASTDFSSTTLYIGTNRFVVAGAEATILPAVVPAKHSDHNLYITKMEVTLGAAPSGTKTNTFTLRHDQATKFSRLDSTIFVGAIVGTNTTVTVVGQEKIDTNTAITVKSVGADAGEAATTVIVELTIEER